MLSLLAAGCGKVWVSLSVKSSTPTSGPTTYKLVFTTEPSSSISAGAALPTGGVIEVEDNNGHLVSTGALSTATITLSDSTGNGGIAGVTTVTASGGIATIPNNTLKFEKSGSTSLNASATVTGYGTLSTNSSAINIATPTFSTVSDFSGPDDPNGEVNGTGTAARLWEPRGLVSDGTNVYVMEGTPNCTMREYNISTGAVTTLAGTLYSCGYADGLAGANTLEPAGELATDGTYVYFANGCGIRRVTIASGAVTTIAGNATSCGYSDNTTGTSARFGDIGGIYLNGTTLYVGDNGNCYIRAVDLSASPYAVTTVAGNGTCGDVDNSSPTSAEVESMDSFSGDSTNLYFTDTTNKVVRQMAWAGGAITTDASGFCGQVPAYLTVSGTTMYVSCQSIIDAATIGTWSWSSVAGQSWDGGEVDGATGTSLMGTGIDGYGNFLSAYGTNIYFSDTMNGGLRVLNGTTDTVTTLAGTPNSGTNWVQNTTALNTHFETLQDFVSDGTSLYGFDFGTNLIPVISLATGASGSPVGYSSWGFSSGFNQVLAYMNGEIYYADPCKIWEVNPSADTRTALAGTGTCGEVEGSFATAEFKGIGAIATDQKNIFIFDNHAIKKLDMSTDTVSVLSGTAGTNGCATGSASASLYDNSVTDMTYLNGNLYFTESCNNSVVAVNTTTGASSIVAGNGTEGYVNSTLLSSEFCISGSGCGGLPITNDGKNLYVDDPDNGAVREINLVGNAVTTLFGSPNQRWQVDGALSGASESPPHPGVPFRNIYYGYGKLYIGHARGIRVVQ